MVISVSLIPTLVWRRGKALQQECRWLLLVNTMVRNTLESRCRSDRHFSSRWAAVTLTEQHLPMTQKHCPEWRKAPIIAFSLVPGFLFQIKTTQWQCLQLSWKPLWQPSTSASLGHNTCLVSGNTWALHGDYRHGRCWISGTKNPKLGICLRKRLHWLVARASQCLVNNLPENS